MSDIDTRKINKRRILEPDEILSENVTNIQETIIDIEEATS